MKPSSSFGPGTGAGSPAADRVPILYLAPWVDFGGSDKGTIDWFRWIDRDRFAPSLITTQPSANRRIAEVFPIAEEVWVLPDLLAGPQFPGFIFDFLHTRGVKVLHIMNSRLGFELLPDLACLDHPPRVVVQLHVEEPSRDGYVRYVTTRYGNLVDAFSVSSRQLARAVEDYDVLQSRIHVIPTGVDAEREFNPAQVAAMEPERDDGFRILYAGRLAEQKDPLLMIDVVRCLVEVHDRVRVDVLGDGPLEPQVREAARAAGLDRHVHFHPPTEALNRWLAASDLVLMTSTFEGVPYTIYEALAMEVPVVAPALPGTEELMEGVGGRLISPRDDAAAYARTIADLIDAPERLRSLGVEGRQRMLDQFTLRGMAAAHEELYKGLLARRLDAQPDPQRKPPPSPLRFATRPTRGTPLVSVVTPCFNHGRYLPGLLEGLQAQDYPAIELIIVDDGSTDPGTIATLEELERGDDAHVIRQEQNRGPSAARNRGIDAARGRYLLFVDADNVLFPGAVRALVDQITYAGERIGFIYPAAQYFGNRDYSFYPPSYSLYALLHGNYIDTCSLMDREIFDSGLQFAEDIELGHEDWDLALALGARDVIGEPSRDRILLYRKHGFTRSDLVEYMRLPFWLEIQDRHPELFGVREDVGAWGRYRGPGAAIKAAWNPALAIVPTEPIDFDDPAGAAVLAALARQSCLDFELIVESPRKVRHTDVRMRRLSPGLAGSRAERIEEAIDAASTRLVLLTDVPHDLLSDPTVIEKLLRSMWVDQELQGIAFANHDAPAVFPFARLEQASAELVTHSLLWRRPLKATPDARTTVQARRELTSLARSLHEETGAMHWRHFPASVPRVGSVSAATEITLARRHSPVAAEFSVRAERKARLRTAPALPAMPQDQVRRWSASATWMPPETLPLVRHRSQDGLRRVVTNDRRPPPGYEIEFDLGSIQRFSPPGTRRLVRRDERFITVPRGSRRHPSEKELGHLEEAPLPLFVAVERAVLADGSETLVAGDRDELRVQARERHFLGFLEGFPINPVDLPSHTLPPESAVLVRCLDRGARRHVYTSVSASGPLQATMTLSAELGSLRREDGEDAVPLYLDEHGRVRTDVYHLHSAQPSPRQMLRWSVAPLTWLGFGSIKGRARATTRRLLDSSRLLARSSDTPVLRQPPSENGAGGRLLGFLWAKPRPDTIELFSAVHPVLGDQFLTHHPIEATDLGYECVESLGFIAARAPLTGTLGGRAAAIPWASRFGERARAR